MGNLSADGKWLWLSGRYDGAIYAFNTDDGSVKTIPVGGMPHGLTVWPQPGAIPSAILGICARSPNNIQGNPNKSKENSLHFLGFLWPNSDFSMSYGD